MSSKYCQVDNSVHTHNPLFLITLLIWLKIHGKSLTNNYDYHCKFKTKTLTYNIVEHRFSQYQTEHGNV